MYYKDKRDVNSTAFAKHIPGITFNDKIVIPVSLRTRIVAWYHEYLVHPGQTRMEKTLRQTLTWPNLRQDVEQYV